MINQGISHISTKKKMEAHVLQIDKYITILVFLQMTSFVLFDNPL